MQKSMSQAKMKQQNKNKLTLNKNGNNFLHEKTWKSFVLPFGAFYAREIIL